MFLRDLPLPHPGGKAEHALPPPNTETEVGVASPHTIVGAEAEKEWHSCWGAVVGVIDRHFESVEDAGPAPGLLPLLH